MKKKLIIIVQEKLNEFTLEIEDNKLFLLKTYEEIKKIIK